MNAFCKNAVCLAAMILSIVPVAAESVRDTASTVVGNKLNFEAPVFGVALKNLKPEWSVVTLGEALMGVSVAFDSPEQLKPAGLYAELSLFDFRWRPWRNSHVFSLGFGCVSDTKWVSSGLCYGERCSFMPVPEGWSKATSCMSEIYMSFPLAYLYEAADWKFSATIVPHLGTTVLQNRYIAEDSILHTDNMSDNFGFRLGFKAGVWYKDYGLAVMYRMKSPHSSANIPYYGTFAVAISIRY